MDRLAGYYHVLDGQTWDIAYWDVDAKRWYFPGSLIAYKDDDFREIGQCISCITH